jgi:prepilin peptidase CpaA
MTVVFSVPLPVAVTLLAVTVVAAATDLHSRRIPNWLTVSGFAAGVAVNATLLGWSGFAAALLGCGLALLIHIPLFVWKLTSGGDVKLMAATGAILGPSGWLVLFVLASIAGGVHALLLIVSRRAAGGVLWNVAHMARAALIFRLPYKLRPELDVTSSRSMTVPRGLSVAIGAVLFLWLA